LSRVTKFEYTDFGNANRFVARHCAHVLYCPSLDLWFIWNKKRYVPDPGDEIERLAMKTILAIPEEEKGASEEASRKLLRWAEKSQSHGRIGGMIRMARLDLRIQVHADELDASPWLFNCNNGTINLLSGEIKD
jgi:putative DNA primase/helicase